jgi:hypothetical protein
MVKAGIITVPSDDATAAVLVNARGATLPVDLYSCDALVMVEQRIIPRAAHPRILDHAQRQVVMVVVRGKTPKFAFEMLAAGMR